MRGMLKGLGKFSGVVFLLLAFFLSFKAVIDPDFGWHLRAGQYIWENHEVPKTDLFSFTLPDYPYVHHSWLTELAIYLFYHVLGLWGVSLFYALVAAGGFWLLAARIEQRRSTLRTRWILLFFVPLVMWVVGMRTQVVTFFLLNLILYLFERIRTVAIHRLLVLPLLFLTWANLHGGFLLGLFFLVLYCGFRAFDISRSDLPPLRKSWLVALLAVVVMLSFVAALVTPYGKGTYGIAATIATNRFNWEHNLDWKPLMSETHTAIFAGMLYLGVLAALASKTVALREKFVIGMFFFLSLVSRHYVLPLLVVLTPPLVLLALHLIARRLRAGRGYVFPLRIAWAAVIIAYTGMGIGEFWKMKEAYSSPSFYATELSRELKYPHGAVSFMQEHGIPQRLLNNLSWGGYLVWQFPGKRFFIDGRMENFFIDGHSFALDYWTMTRLESGWDRLLSQYGIDGILAPGQPGKTWPLTEFLRRDASWRIVYEDGVSLLAVRSEDQ